MMTIEKTTIEKMPGANRTKDFIGALVVVLTALLHLTGATGAIACGGGCEDVAEESAYEAVDTRSVPDTDTGSTLLDEAFNI